MVIMMTELNNEELEEYRKLNSKESKKTDLKNPLKENMNYIMIALLSVMQVVLSCLSSVDGSIQFVFPTTVWGWILLIAPKVATSVLGYMIWTNFFDKGKELGKKTDDYKKSIEILNEIQGKSDKNLIHVVNPLKWEKDTKIKKGVKMVLILLLTTFLISELIVAFNVASLVASLVSILFSFVWGFQMMNKAEEMFSTGYYQYATLLKVQFESERKAQKELKKDENNSSIIEEIRKEA